MPWQVLGKGIAESRKELELSRTPELGLEFELCLFPEGSWGRKWALQGPCPSSGGGCPGGTFRSYWLVRRGEQGTGIAVFQAHQRSQTGCVGLLPSSPFLFLAFTPQELSQPLPGPLPQMVTMLFHRLQSWSYRGRQLSLFPKLWVLMNDSLGHQAHYKTLLSLSVPLPIRLPPPHPPSEDMLASGVTSHHWRAHTMGSSSRELDSSGGHTANV